MAKSNTHEEDGRVDPQPGTGKLPVDKAPSMPPAGPHDAPELVDPLATPGTGVLPPVHPEDDIDAVSS